MGARHSKRSVDITTTPKKGEEGAVVEGEEGRLEKLAEPDLKVTTNGTALHNEIEFADKEETSKDEIEDREKVESKSEIKENGLPEEPSNIVVESKKSEAESEKATEQVNGETEKTPDKETPEQKVEDTPEQKKKKEKKKKWSFRSISFSKKDKSKPSKESSDKNGEVKEVAEEVVEDETTSSSTNQQPLDLPTPSLKAKLKKKSSQVDEAYNFLREAKEKLSRQDRFSSFGEVIACKLRSLNDPRLQAMAEFEISKILFEVEMQSLNKQSSYPTIVRSSNTLKSDNSRPGSSTNCDSELSNSITPEMLSPNSETLSNDITTDPNQNSTVLRLQYVQQLNPDISDFLTFHT